MRTFTLAAAAAIMAGSWFGRGVAASPTVSSDPASVDTIPAGYAPLAEVQSADCCWVFFGGRWWCVPC